MTARIGSLFTGYGGLDLAVESVFDARTVWTADIDPGACKIIAARFGDVPNLGDITGVDWSTVPPVDVLTGGFPCQDVSAAGLRAGLADDTRSGLWSVMADAINKLRPALVIAENVRGLLSARADSDVEPCPHCLGDESAVPPLRALGAVLGDLADLGYDTQWATIAASDVGACHRRDRVFIAARPAGDADCSTSGQRWQPAPSETEGGRTRANTGRPNRTPTPDAAGGHAVTDQRRLRSQPRQPNRAPTADAAGVGRGEGRPEPAGQQRRPHHAVSSASADFGAYTPAVHRWARVIGRPAPAPTVEGRTGHRLNPRFVEWMMGLPDGWVCDVPDLSRTAQLKALGNGVVPQQAAAAIRTLDRWAQVAA